MTTLRLTRPRAPRERDKAPDLTDRMAVPVEPTWAQPQGRGDDFAQADRRRRRKGKGGHLPDHAKRTAQRRKVERQILAKAKRRNGRRDRTRIDQALPDGGG